MPPVSICRDAMRLEELLGDCFVFANAGVSIKWERPLRWPFKEQQMWDSSANKGEPITDYRDDFIGMANLIEGLVSFEGEDEAQVCPLNDASNHFSESRLV
jgi:hypothetical protein